MRIQPGDHIIVQQRDSGQIRIACVDNVTKGGRVVAWWYRLSFRRGNVVGEPTKPRALDPNKETVVCLATVEEAAAFKGDDRR